MDNTRQVTHVFIDQQKLRLEDSALGLDLSVWKSSSSSPIVDLTRANLADQLQKVETVSASEAMVSRYNSRLYNTSATSSVGPCREVKSPTIDVVSRSNIIEGHAMTSSPAASKSTSVGVSFAGSVGKEEMVMSSSSSSPRADGTGEQQMNVFGTLRRGGSAELRHGWSAKSPKSYWLRRHSDSLLVAGVVGDQQVHGRGRQWSQADTYAVEDVTDFETPNDRQGAFSVMLGSATASKLIAGDRPQVDCEPSDIPNRTSTSSKMDFQLSGSSFDYDDVFDDDQDEESPFKDAQAASTCYMSKLSIPDGSSLDGRTESPSAVFAPTTFSADEIAMRLEKLQSIDRRLSRSQRLSSGCGVEDQCCAALPRIMEEHEERQVAVRSLTRDGRMRENYPVPRDYYAADDVQLPTRLPSGSLVDPHVRDTERVNRQSVNMDSSAEELITTTTTTTTTRRPRSSIGGTSGSSGSRQSCRPMSPSRESNSPMSMCSAATSVDSSSGTKLHRCSVCRRSFARSDMLERHARLHTGVRPYSCRLCSQVFSRSDHLTTHLRTHTGEKPYQCPRCSYSASRRDMVTRHLRVHVHDNRVDTGGSIAGSGASPSSNLLSPVTVGGSLSGRRRQVRIKKKERLQHRGEMEPCSTVSVSNSGSQVFNPTSSWLPQATKSVIATDDVGLVGSSTASCPPPLMRRQPSWISSSNCTDSVIKGAVDLWARSMVVGCLASPSPMRSPSMTSFRHCDEAAIASGGLSMILARGSTGSTDSYSSPGGCSAAGGGDVFEFGGMAEGSPDVFRSPAAAARQTLKFLWPLATQPAASSCSASSSSYDASAD